MPGSRAPVKSTCEQGLSTQPVITSGVYVLFIKVAYFPICVSTITVLQRKYTRSSNASNYTDFDLRISHAYSKLFLNEKNIFLQPTSAFIRLYKLHSVSSESVVAFKFYTSTSESC